MKGTLAAAVIERLQTPEGHQEWEQQFHRLEAQLTVAKDRYAHERTLESLRLYELAVRASLAHDLVFYRAYSNGRPRSSDGEAVDFILPVLKATIDRLMDVAEEYVKQENRATARAIAGEVLTQYEDLPGVGTQQRANVLLFQYRGRESM